MLQKILAYDFDFVFFFDFVEIVFTESKSL